MVGFVNFINENAVLLLFLLVGVGSLIGRIRIRGVGLGSAAVLFLAIAVGAWAGEYGVTLQIPAVLGTLGLCLFTYCIGVQNGPSFVARIRQGALAMLCVAVAIAAGGFAVLGLGKALRLSSALIGGTFAGAVTNTPALAAAIEASGDSGQTTVGYSISYVFGVIGMMILASIVLARTRRDLSDAEAIERATIRVERERAELRDLLDRKADSALISRYQRHSDHRITAFDDASELYAGDLVTVVGHPDAVATMVEELGHRSTHALERNPSIVSSRGILVSKEALAGRTIAELQLHERFGVVVTRIRRGDSEILATAGEKVQLGDRLWVVGPIGRLRAAAADVGDSLRGVSEINPIALGIGMTLGVLLGMVSLPIIEGGFEIGAAAGTLIAGLVFGQIGRVGPLVTGMGSGAAHALSEIGLLMFLAWAGVNAGGQILAAFSGGGQGLTIAMVGATGTTVVALALWLGGRILRGVGPAEFSGMIAAAQTQPAIFGFANERTGHDPRVTLGYATVYPVAMVVKILLAQVFVFL